MRCPKPRHGGRQGIRFGRHRGLAWVWANQLKACCSYRRSSTVICYENCWTLFFQMMEWLLLLCSYFLVTILHHKSFKQTHEKKMMSGWSFGGGFVFVGNLLGQVILWCCWRKILLHPKSSRGCCSQRLVYWRTRALKPKFSNVAEFKIRTRDQLLSLLCKARSLKPESCPRVK